MKRIAIIGSCGYVGNICYSYLTSNNDIDVTCYDIAPTDVFPPHRQLKSSAISVEDIRMYDVILYFAGIHTEACDSISYDTVFDINVNEPCHIVKHLTEKQLFIYASTAAVYSDTMDRLSSETTHINIESLTKYERSMVERELAISSKNKKSIGLRMGSVISISNNMRLDSLYSGIYKQLLLDANVRIWNKNAQRSILWHKDLTAAISKIIDSSTTICGSSVYNLTSFNTTVYDVAKYAVSFNNKEIVEMGSSISRGFKIDISKFCDTFDYTVSGNIEIIHSAFILNKNTFIELINKQCCVVCGKTLSRILNLGEQPLANDLRTTPQATCKYPLELYRCYKCNHTQIGHFVDKATLFSNYLYESGTSLTSKLYFADFAERYSARTTKKERNILEIACNDGSQLNEFKAQGWNTYGVDPAENLTSTAKLNDHNVLCDYWGSMKTPFQSVKFDLIVAQNVLAHVTTPVAFVRQCVECMNDDTLLVIQTSQSNMYFNGEFDTIYHEHISFFTIKSMQYLAKLCGCTLVNVYKTPIHGTSYVFELKKGIHTDIKLPLLDEENRRGLYNETIYQRFKESASLTKSIASSLITTYKSNNYRIIGYGAAAKGNVFLNYLSDSSPHSNILPECIIDESSLKLNKYTPCTHIPIKSINTLNSLNNTKLCIIVTAWNFISEIEKKIVSHIEKSNLHMRVELLVFFPDLHIVRLKDTLRT